ncbi:hypothetical protein [Limosilactobacillus reuteri]|uniref:hypothetical protein n=1 Tax=Limosilactobacillus reuteri TaxID=1598 RepID=UPI00129B4D7B|nr:hypothetical protein [Limosilactobacillus reuteri]MCC4331512.1 hypothetical protein [Limosilactobacillus reuteri]MCC4354799.1 hypothetical protein [Limosilactobacillus reuteri]MRI08493.1 hypothetical protein [Limosilactobacillus reuteri]
MTTEELIQNRKHLLQEYSHKYQQYFDGLLNDVTNGNDVNDFLELTDKEQIILVNYCLTAFRPINTINYHNTSYGLKHHFEHYPFGFYVSNGQFKAGMLLAGYLPKDKNILNWCYAISENSPGDSWLEDSACHWRKYYIPLDENEKRY